MQNLDIILEGAMLGAELEVLAEGTSTSDDSMVTNFKRGLASESAYYINIIKEVQRQTKSDAIDKICADAKESISTAATKDVDDFKKSLKKIHDKFNKAQKSIDNAESGEAYEKNKSDLDKAIKEITSEDYSSGQNSNTIKACAKAVKDVKAKVDKDEDAKAALKGSTFADGDDKLDLDGVVKKANEQAKKAANSKSVIRKTINAIKDRMRSAYESFKNELSNPSWKGISLAAVGAVASYGILYGVLKSFKLEGIGAVTNPVSNIKLAIKVATTPSVYGGGKSALIVAILTILAGAIGITGTMVFNLIRSKFKSKK